MEKYLTKKAVPGKAVRFLDNAVLVILFGVLGAWICYVVSIGQELYEADLLGLVMGLLLAALILIPTILFVLVMNPFAERLRARTHAQRIVKALLDAGGCIPADEAEERIGVRAAADRAQALASKGYLKDVRMERGFLLLAEAEDQLPPKQEVRQLFHDVEV